MGRVVATVTRRFGDLDAAENAAAEAFAAAVERWLHDGVPPNPGAWLTTSATRKAIDRLRRESHRDEKYREARLLFDDAARGPLGRSPSRRSTGPTSRSPWWTACRWTVTHAFHATRAELLRRLGRGAEAREAYDRAIELAGNTAESAYLTRRRGHLSLRRSEPDADVRTDHA